MIIQETFEIEISKNQYPLKISMIENAILKKNIDFVRYCILKKEKNKIIISVNGIKNN